MKTKTSQSKSLLLIIILINLCVMLVVVVLAKSDHDHHHHHHHDDHQHGHKLKKAKKIYNGRRATNQEARFMAAILVPFDGGISLRCSAVIITHDVVLTAAHCFDNFSHPEIRRMEVLPGATHIGSSYLGTHRDLIRTIKAFWIHPEYETGNHPYDLALIKVGPTPWVLGNRVTVAQMPIRIKSQGPPIKAYGYGREYDDVLSGNLNVIEYTRIYNQAYCELMFGIRFKEPDISFATKERSPYHQQLHISSGQAKGDSGGGVFVKGVVERFDTSANSWIQIYTEILVGILSLGSVRNETMRPRLYFFHTNITTFLPRIKSLSGARLETYPFPKPLH